MSYYQLSRQAIWRRLLDDFLDELDDDRWLDEEHADAMRARLGITINDAEVVPSLPHGSVAA